MNLANHYKMAETIYSRIRRKGLSLKRFPFILGNLVPDLCFSFMIRRHEHGCSAASVRKTIFRLYEGRFDPCSAPFAYFMGVVCHYVCDYFCYSHSPAFQGNLWDHIKYEWVQRMPDAGEISFCRREGPSADFSPFMDTLDAYIRNHDREPRRDAASAQTDITTGMAAAEWLTETVFRSAERLSFSPVVPFRRMPFLWARLFSGRRTA